ncbi:hypothetical protein LOD99_10363 [Oopsacas minuta]|uniref:Hikeshi-like domain-containing protein n=1 Tax=Oopsacas minuta TaxID=111878 RepID=A0AAV7KHN6_9METZ|nr:hypothetical protein LOD99_10363 [Oopsacas minuta]
MFGYLVAGRLPNTEISQVSDTVYVMQLDSVSTVNHLCVFMTGAVPFPDGYGGSIHIGWPSQDQPDPLWEYMGCISNEKPSAIFRLSRRDLVATGGNPGMFSALSHNISNTSVLIGISVEQLMSIVEKVPDKKSEAVTVDFQTQFVSKMMDSFVNHALSYEIQPAAINPLTTEQYIPSHVVKSWIEKFQTQMNLDPYFWKK